MKMMNSFLSGMFLFLAFTTSALAAQNATVVVQEAQVFDKPQPDAVALGKVLKDAVIPVSNVQTNGFYKTRIPGGIVGWISGTDVFAPPGAIAPVPTPAPDTQKAPPSVVEKKSSKKKKDFESEGDHSRIILSGGMQILNNAGFPAQIPITGSKTGYGGTAELQFKLSSMFHLGGRIDYFTSSSSQTTTGGTAQTFTFQTLPIMGGITFSPVNTESFRLGIGGYFGVAVASKLTITQGTSNVEYASTDLCEYVNLQMAYRLGRSFGLYGEGGYRLQSSTYPASTLLSAAGFKADYGGIVARFGVELRF